MFSLEGAHRETRFASRPVARTVFQISETIFYVAELSTEWALSIRNLATLCSEVELPIRSQEDFEQGR